MELHICKQCGLVAPKGTTVCPRCGRALPPTKAEASRPRYTIHVDPDMVQYWDDEDEDEFPLKEDPFFMWYGGEQQEEMGTGHYLATLLLFAIPVVGVTYEFNRFVGRHDNAVTRVLSAPGMWLQNFTTNEPDDSMLEVAIEALKLVLPEEQGKDAW